MTNTSEIALAPAPAGNAPPAEAPTNSKSTGHLTIPGKPKIPAFATAEGAATRETSKAKASEGSEGQNLLPIVLEEHLPVPVNQGAAADRGLPFNLHRVLVLIKDGFGKIYAVQKSAHNPVALPLRSKKFNALIADCALRDCVTLRPNELAEINEILEAYADQYGEATDLWYRVAKTEGGIEIDFGDEAHTRVRITAGKVEMLESGSKTVFGRTANMKPMTVPTTGGNLRLLDRYLNVSPPERLLLLAWITYTIAHPKGCGSKYVFLVLQGNEGSGKSNLSKLLLRLIDPTAIGVQTFPNTTKDLAIAGQHAHVLAFDNLRSFKDHMADALCIASTGGAITSRKLYTDAEQQAIPLHVALILNGIHSFVDQPDLTQRCLPIHLSPIDPAKRKPEEVITAELEADLPLIMGGLFELIAKIFENIQDAELTNPERMIEFSRWLAAMERVEGIPAGVYQGLYSDVLRQGQLDTLMDNPLAAAIIQFADEMDAPSWSGTPTELLTKLGRAVGVNTQRSREWPQNPIALSKRIAGLQAGLRSQGILIELTRGKERMVTISKVEGDHDDRSV